MSSHELRRDEDAARAYHAGMERARQRRATIQGRLMQLHAYGVTIDDDTIVAFHRELDAKTDQERRP